MLGWGSTTWVAGAWVTGAWLGLNPVGIDATSTQRLPLAGSAAAQVIAAAATSRALPLDGVAVASGPGFTGSPAWVPGSWGSSWGNGTWVGMGSSGVPDLTAVSVRPLPLSASAAAAVGIAAVTNRPLPLGGSASIQQARTAASVAALPLGGSAHVAQGRSVDSSAPLPLGGSATVGVLVRATSARRLPLGGTVEGINDAPEPPLPPLELSALRNWIWPTTSRTLSNQELTILLNRRMKDLENRISTFSSQTTALAAHNRALLDEVKRLRKRLRALEEKEPV